MMEKSNGSTRHKESFLRLRPRGSLAVSLMDFYQRVVSSMVLTRWLLEKRMDG